MKRHKTVALAVAVALIVGCGGSDGSDRSSGETARAQAEESASQSAQALSKALAMAKQEGPAGARGVAVACDLMTRQAQEELVASAIIAAGPRGEAEGCEEALLYLATRSGSRRSPIGAEARVVHVGIRESLAKVVLEDPDGQQSTMTLVKEKGRWKLAATE